MAKQNQDSEGEGSDTLDAGFRIKGTLAKWVLSHLMSALIGGGIGGTTAGNLATTTNARDLEAIESKIDVATRQMEARAEKQNERIDRVLELLSRRAAREPLAGVPRE